MYSGLLLLQNRRPKHEGLKTNCRELGFDILERERERKSAFSLRSRAIRPSDFFEPRRKVALRDEDNTWTPVLGSFDKLREVGFYPTCFALDLSVL